MEKVANEGSQRVKDMQQMSKRYETARKKKEHLKQGDEQKNLYITTIKLTLIHKKYN